MEIKMKNKINNFLWLNFFLVFLLSWGNFRYCFGGGILGHLVYEMTN